MGALVVFKKSDDELRAIDTLIILKGLRQSGRYPGRDDQHYRTEN
jgi:hypothetical protein